MYEMKNRGKLPLFSPCYFSRLPFWPGLPWQLSFLFLSNTPSKQVHGSGFIGSQQDDKQKQQTTDMILRQTN
jgi:hypothetical protein